MLILELWEDDHKVAECEASEVFSMDKDKLEAFWSVQDDLNREIRLRVQEEGEK